MILDLTHCISPEMPVYPGTEQPVLTTACTIREAGYRETILHMYSHTGTHMDAPAHMIEGGKTLDAFPAEAFVGPGLALDCRGLREIPLSLLRAHEDEIRRADFLLFCTGWDKRWGRAEYYPPGPSRITIRLRLLAGPSAASMAPHAPQAWSDTVISQGSR